MKKKTTISILMLLLAICMYGQKNGSIYEVGDSIVNCETNFENLMNNWTTGYSSQSVSSSYAISYVLDYFNTGLKIAYRANSSAVFKTQQTLYSSDTDKYYPSICQ